MDNLYTKGMPTKTVFRGPIRYNILLAAALLLILQNLKAVDAEWRYRPVHRFQKLLLTNEFVYLEHISATSEGGSTPIGWNFSTDCSLSTVPSPCIHCRKEGFHKIAPVFDIMKIWVMDPIMAGKEEMEGMTFFPGKNSRDLGVSFHNLGQYPTITLPNSMKVYGEFKEGYWEVEINWPLPSLTIDVSGQSISFKHRFIRDSQRSFFWDPYEEMRDDTEDDTLELTLRPAFPSMLLQDACSPNLCLFLTKNNLYYSFSLFKSVQMLSVVPNENYPSADTVEAAVLLEDGVILKMLGNLFWLPHGSKVLELNPRVYAENVTEITQRTTCLTDYPGGEVDVGKFLLVLQNLTSVYLGGSHSLSIRKTSGGFYDVFEAPGKQVVSASFSSDPYQVAILWRDSDGYVSLYIYNIKAGYHDKNNLLDKLGIQPIGFLKMHFIESFKQSFVMWNGSMMWYSFRDNSDCGILGTKDTVDLSHAAGGSSIVQVVVDTNWNLLVRMSNNRLFSCKWGMTQLLLLEKWLPNWVNSHLYVYKNDIYFLWEDSSWYRSESYPLEMERLNILGVGKEHNCPYVTFEHNMKKYYYLDRGEEHVFWAQLVYLEGKGVNIQVLRSNNRLQFEISNSLDMNAGVFTTNMTIKAKQDKHIMYPTGLMKVEVLPNLLGHKCQLPENRVSYFSVGCPPQRRIVHWVPNDIETDNSIFNFTIPGSVLRNPQDDDVVKTYDPKVAGPIMKIHYKTAFKPLLLLLEGGKVIKDVDANFIVWEINGRTDFSYNTTMEQAGCLREAQTSASVVDERGWGPWNYKSCFVLENKPLGDMAQPYEIMNRSFSNSITFSQQDSAVYMFQVMVVDPMYSFCDYQTIFAVQTTGISKPKHDHLILYATLSFAFVCLCLLAYAYFRYTKIFQDLQKKKRS